MNLTRTINPVALLFTVLTSTLFLGCAPTTTIMQPDPTAIIHPENLDEVIPRLLEADYVLLGEEHDQPAIHLFRARLIKALAKHRSLLISLEHVTRDKQSLLDDNLAHPENLPGALDWNRSGWPKWSMFAPLFETLRDTRAIVRCGNRKTNDNFDDLASYGLNSLLPHESRLKGELEKMHPPSMKIPMERMVLAQRRRDAGFAASLDEGNAEMRILLAGNGHVRKDYGVPWYIRFHNPGARVLSIGITTTEVKAKEKGVFDYLVRL
jgi:uncharacterized iron-regulated protein